MGSGDPSEAPGFVIWGVGLKADSGQEGGSTSAKTRPKAYCLVLLSSPMTVAKTYRASSPGLLMICCIIKIGILSFHKSPAEFEFM